MKRRTLKRCDASEPRRTRRDGRDTPAGSSRSAVRRIRCQRQSTTPGPLDGTQTFRVTHVFHPLRGQEFTLVDQRNAWREDRVDFHDDTGRLRRLPTAWTSAAPPDAFVALSAGRSHFRVEDLLQLVALIARQRPVRAPARERRGKGGVK